jgi:hypothetical protein
MLPPDVAANLRPEPGQQLSALSPTMEWFRATFRQASSSGGGGGGIVNGGSSGNGDSSSFFGQDEVDEAMGKARGLEGAVEQLQQASRAWAGLFQGAGRGQAAGRGFRAGVKWGNPFGEFSRDNCLTILAGCV